MEKANYQPLVIKDLSRVFNGRTALSNVSFELNEGEFLAILGRNGAGKSTLINILADILQPSSGSIELFEKSVSDIEAKKLRGVVFQEHKLEGLFTGKEILVIHGLYYGLSKKQSEDEAEKILSFMELLEYANKRITTYSVGMKRRLEVGRALLHKPRLLLLDEPTSDLDIEIREKIWALLRKMKNEFKLSILLSTHDLTEAKELADRVIVLENGNIVKEVKKQNISKNEAFFRGLLGEGTA